MPTERSTNTASLWKLWLVGLPGELKRSLTWDQGSEMAEHARLKVDAGLDIYFCDLHIPWQRAKNENTNGLLRQYFPKVTDLSAHGPVQGLAGKIFLLHLPF